MDLLTDCLFVGAGGMVGAISRYLVGMVPVRTESSFPFITLLINVAGAFCIGAIMALFGEKININPRMLLFLKVGLCGGFTTFSTFSLETVNLIQNGNLVTAMIYVIFSVCLCVFAVVAAQMIF